MSCSKLFDVPSAHPGSRSNLVALLTASFFPSILKQKPRSQCRGSLFISPLLLRNMHFPLELRGTLLPWTARLQCCSPTKSSQVTLLIQDRSNGRGICECGARSNFGSIHTQDRSHDIIVVVTATRPLCRRVFVDDVGHWRLEFPSSHIQVQCSLIFSRLILVLCELEATVEHGDDHLNTSCGQERLSSSLSVLRQCCI